MAISPNFPTDPHVILDPAERWYPGDEIFTDTGYATLLPPLVFGIRKEVKKWRDSDYAGASATTKALLHWWFETEHLMPQADGTTRQFRYYFGQREAVESAIWLYEVEQARDPYGLIKHDESGRVSKGMFDEDWTRYVMKLATGTGKTKVMSLLLAWSYYHKRYETDSDLSMNFLVIAPNIIVLDRLLLDFDGLRIFHEDPVRPDNGYEGQNWQDDFQPTLHIQDQVHVQSDTGNIYLTNIHRVYEGRGEPSFEDEDTTDYFLGRRPTGKTTDSKVDLGDVVRDVPDLVIFNDEAHHIHDPEMAWFKNIQDIASRLRLRGSRLSAQFDLTATPKHNNGAIFVQTISDYPLVEAIRQGIVKLPVLPDGASRAKLSEKASDKFTERYQDYLYLGYLEWQKESARLAPHKKAVLFVMTDDTRNCDEVGAWLEERYPEFRDAVLVIHTKNNGDISESSTGKSKEELEKLRKLAREIDEPENKYKAVVSVMVLREGWDVKNVVAMVGLRPFKAKSQILPEQALGRGLRPMFRGEHVTEKVSVVGTDAFMDFVEAIRSQGVELELTPMGWGTKGKSPLVVEVDSDNPKKNIPELDIELPLLQPRVYREYKVLDELDCDRLPKPSLPLKQFSPDEQRQIVFRDIDTGDVSHMTVLDTTIAPSHQAAVGFFARTVMRDLRLVGGFDILFGKVKQFIERNLFAQPVDMDNLNVLRNLSEPGVTSRILETFKTAINNLTVRDRGTTRIEDSIKLSKSRPMVVSDQSFVQPKRSVFNRVVADNHFELEFAAFLDCCDDIVSFAKNAENVRFKIEYQTATKGIANYLPDFVVKETPTSIWIIETKGREDVEDPHKWERLCQWCEDATTQSGDTTYKPLFVRQEDWERYTPKTFKALVETFGSAAPRG